MPIEAPAGTLEVENAKFRASSVEATNAVGIGTDSNDAYPLQVFKETAPSIRLSEGSTISSAARLYSNNSNLYIQTGADFTAGSSGDVAFQTMGGESTHMVIKNDGKVGIGVTDPARPLTIESTSYGGLRVKRTTSGGGSAMEFINGNEDIWTVGIGGNGVFGVYKDSIFGEQFLIDTSGNVGIGTTSPIAALDIDAGANDTTTPALSIRGGLYDPSDLYVLNTYNVNTGVGYAAKVIGVNIKNKVETDNTVQLRNNVGGITSAGAIYLGSDDINQGIFGVLGGSGVAGTTLSEHLTVRANGRVGIGVANPSYKLHVSGGLSYFPDGIYTPGYHAQWTLSGGGHVTWDGTNLLWSYRIIALPVERTEFSSDGYIDINCPTSGTITYYKGDGTTGTATCTSSGVPIGSWEALWYVVTPGQSRTSNQTKFVLTYHSNSNWKPNSNWLLIAVKNGDTASQRGLKFMPTNSVLRTWIAPTFTDNWVNYDNTYNHAGYYKDSENRVHLRGLVKNGSTGSDYDIFILPVGFRPERRHIFCAATNPSSTSCRIDITDDGRVIPYSGVSSSWVSLDNISFTAT